MLMCVSNLSVKINKLDDRHVAPLGFYLLVSVLADVLFGSLLLGQVGRALNITYINRCNSLLRRCIGA